VLTQLFNYTFAHPFVFVAHTTEINDKWHVELAQRWATGSKNLHIYTEFAYHTQPFAWQVSGCYWRGWKKFTQMWNLSRREM